MVPDIGTCRNELVFVEKSMVLMELLSIQITSIFDDSSTESYLFPFTGYYSRFHIYYLPLM